MTILRILHIGQIASAMLPPGFQRPEDDGFPAAERTAKALAVARARPQLLMSPRPARRPPYRLAQRAPETIIYPDHQIHRTPFNAAAAIVIAIQHPARRGRRGGNGGEKCLIRRACQFGRQYRRSSSIQGSPSLCARRRAKVDLPEPLVPTTLIFISVSPRLPDSAWRYSWIIFRAAVPPVMPRQRMSVHLALAFFGPVTIPALHRGINHPP